MAPQERELEIGVDPQVLGNAAAEVDHVGIREGIASGQLVGEELRAWQHLASLLLVPDPLAPPAYGISLLLEEGSAQGPESEALDLGGERRREKRAGRVGSQDAVSAAVEAGSKRRLAAVGDRVAPAAKEHVAAEADEKRFEPGVAPQGAKSEVMPMEAAHMAFCEPDRLGCPAPDPARLEGQ
jgi:hypothetical protein